MVKSQVAQLTFDEILSSPAAVLIERATAERLDEIIESSPDPDDRIRSWNKVAAELVAKGVSSGHAHFRLGILHLVNDPDEAAGISHLTGAYEQDQQFAVRTEPHRMAAYRVLSLVKDFLGDLSRRKDWQALQLDPKHRRVLISTLLALYDATARATRNSRGSWRYIALTSGPLDIRQHMLPEDVVGARLVSFAPLL